jgi:hypothetical protein
MAKTTIISILTIVIIGGIIFYISKSTQGDFSSMVDSSDLQAENANQIEQVGKKMAFSEFLKQDTGSYQCTVNQYIDEGMSQTTQGTVFIYNGNIRGDFETTVSGMNIVSSMIVQDTYSYTWSNMAPVGYKVALDKNQIEENNNQAMSRTYNWNAEQIGEYDCQEWNVDKTKFELPQNITFQEI